MLLAADATTTFECLQNADQLAQADRTAPSFPEIRTHVSSQSMRCKCGERKANVCGATGKPLVVRNKGPPPTGVLICRSPLDGGKQYKGPAVVMSRYVTSSPNRGLISNRTAISSYDGGRYLMIYGG